MTDQRTNRGPELAESTTLRCRTSPWLIWIASLPFPDSSGSFRIFATDASAAGTWRIALSRQQLRDRRLQRDASWHYLEQLIINTP